MPDVFKQKSLNDQAWQYEHWIQLVHKSTQSKPSPDHGPTCHLWFRGHRLCHFNVRLRGDEEFAVQWLKHAALDQLAKKDIGMYRR